MDIQNISVNELIPYVNNPRNNANAVDKVAASIKEFGFKVPIVIDKEKVVVAGHTRLLAAKKLGLTEVPCIIADDLSEQQIKAFRLADNKVSEFAEWDMEKLAIEIEMIEFDLEEFGFDIVDKDSLEATEDDYEAELPEEPKTKIGDIYQLGRHRLMCGDSTSASDAAILMGGSRAHMCFTDPPYNINYGNIKHPKFKQRKIQNDNMSSEEFAEFCGKFMDNIVSNVIGCVYVAGPSGPNSRIMFVEADKRMHCSTTIVWNKDVFTLGRGKYQNKYEPIWFGWVESGNRFSDSRQLTNVWDIQRPKKSDLHPTMKPIELVAKAINDASLPDDIVLDLFGGSGSTMIAAQQTGRTCYMMELDPKYCDVIVDRWEKLTGQQAELISG